MFNVAKLAAPPEFLDKNGFARIPGGPAFMYLFRRYGYPNFYGDKNIAEYAVETAVPGVFVLFSIKSSWCWIKAMADEDMDWRYIQEEAASRASVRAGGNYSEFCQKVHTAVRDTLLDQLRPVRVDDERINILGPGEFEWDEKAEAMRGEVPYKKLG